MKRGQFPTQPKIAVIGLGYVGLPLAVEFGKHFHTTGFDINQDRVDELRAGGDSTRELSPDELAAIPDLHFTTRLDQLTDCNVYIVTVPTPIDAQKRADFRPLVDASRSVGSVLAPGDVVIYESTVYPGATEEICIPELEMISGLAVNMDFAVGYSPERINPGDKQRRLPDIQKVTSGSTPEAAEFVDRLYGTIIPAGTHKAPSIKVAEAAKIIENTQRDANIALLNEFALIFERLGIDTGDVLAAAKTKWNFLNFQPGLVGGHCIGVDPYYLIQKAQSTGYYPDILLACRRINETMGEHVASQVIKLMLKRNQRVSGGRVLVMGLTFKEDCPDLRNSRVVDLVAALKSYGIRVDVVDPWADKVQAKKEYGLEVEVEPDASARFGAVVIAVGHQCFREMGEKRIRQFGLPGAVLYDVKGILPRGCADARL